MLRTAEIDALEDQGELDRAHRHAALPRLCHGHAEAAALEPLAEQGIAPMVVPEDLAAITPAVEEAEQVTRERILLEHVLDECREPIEGLAVMRSSA
jgi:hypothetical protein